MMKLRLHGTKTEIEKFIKDINKFYGKRVLNVSTLYQDTRKIEFSKYYRCYIEIDS